MIIYNKIYNKSIIIKISNFKCLNSFVLFITYTSSYCIRVKNINRISDSFSLTGKIVQSYTRHILLIVDSIHSLKSMTFVATFVLVERITRSIIMDWKLI